MKELTKALVAEGKTDLKAARALLDSDIYARAIFHCQQALEKLAKGILIEEGHGTIIAHSVSTLLAMDIMKKTDEEEEKGIREAIGVLSGLERQFGRTRYPINIKGKIFEPSRDITRKEADKWLKEATEAFTILENYLVTRYP